MRSNTRTIVPGPGSNEGPCWSPDGTILAFASSRGGSKQIFVTDPQGLPRVVPDSTDAVAHVVGLAHEHGWKLRVEGNGSWLHADAPADLALSTRALDRVDFVSRPTSSRPCRGV